MDRITSLDDVNSWLNAHQALWLLDEFQSLGRFHLCIDTADVKICEKMHYEEPCGLSDFKRLELTSFGEKVGGDVPRWWVFAGELNVRDLWNKTKLTFLAAQALVRSVEKIGRKTAPTYEHFIQDLGGFLQQHSHEIEALLAYAKDLFMKDELAPAILFSYAVWGSTRRGDRSLAEYFEKERVGGKERVLLAGELALGIRRPIAPTLDWECFNLLHDASEAVPDEEPSSITAAELLRVAQIRIRENIVTYFTEVRDSLRHIDTLCQEFLQRESIYADDSFVKRLLKKISGQRSAVEPDLWELKETLEMWSSRSEGKKDAAIKFAECVAAFANKRGGLLLIGITNSTHEIRGVDDAENRIKHIETVLRKYIEPQVDFVRTRTVPIEGGLTPPPCIVIVVGQTDVPIGVRQKNNSYSYPLRVGSGIERVSREQIMATKAHMKGTIFHFASELAMWVSDVA
jgi:hypothetical protein